MLTWRQVGDPGTDHAVWGRAEDMTMPRPSFDVDQNNPGSDLLGQTAAALAAISIAFETIDAPYALKLEAHARDLYACVPSLPHALAGGIRRAQHAQRAERGKAAACGRGSLHGQR